MTLDEIALILKRTMPFQVVGEAMLRKVAGLARPATYTKGAVIYNVGDKADDIFILVSGNVEHALEPGVKAAHPVQTLAPGDVFGWAALLAKYPTGWRRPCARDDTDVIRISGEELLRLLETDPDAATSS